MQQFYEPPPFNYRIDLHQMFRNVSSPSTSDFVPFNQERDKLGRLLSQQNIKRNASIQRIRSKLSLHLGDPEKIKLKINDSDKAIEKIFKLNVLRSSKSSRSVEKIKIVSGRNQRISVPTIGYYDSAQLISKFKFKKPEETKIKAQKKQSNSKQKRQPIIKEKVGNQKREQLLQKQKSFKKKLEIDYNLPQLQRYHQSKRLKMNIVNNFEENHKKFKDLVRFSLVLANNIKKQLDFD